MIDGVIDGLDYLFVPILVVFNFEQDVVDIDRTVKFLGPRKKHTNQLIMISEFRFKQGLGKFTFLSDTTS